MNRRNLIKSSVASISLLSMPSIVSALHDENRSKKQISIKNNDIILFQGDSLTEGVREYEYGLISNSPRALGEGFVRVCAGALLSEYCDKNLKIYNMGISGNTVSALLARWENDCIKIKPDVLNILVGVNDFYFRYWKGWKGSAEIYKKEYRELLSLTKENLPDTEIIICEPFAFTTDGKSVTDEWFPAFDEYREVAALMAEEFGTIFIPYYTIFKEVLEKAPADYWVPDGIHPGVAGYYLMAEKWLKYCIK